MDAWEVMQGLADQIGTAIGTAVPDLQILGYFNSNPTPPSLDVYPAEVDAREPLTFRGARDLNLTVRARTHTAAREEGQKFLVDMMGDGPTSVGKAIRSDRTIGGRCSGLSVMAMSGFQLMIDAGGDGAYLGVTWTVKVVP